MSQNIRRAIVIVKLKLYTHFTGRPNLVDSNRVHVPCLCTGHVWIKRESTFVIDQQTIFRFKIVVEIYRMAMRLTA